MQASCSRSTGGLVLGSASTCSPQSAWNAGLPLDNRQRPPLQVEDMDYRRVTVVGKYEHESELLLTPRTRLREVGVANQQLVPRTHSYTPHTTTEQGCNRGR